MADRVYHFIADNTASGYETSYGGYGSIILKWIFNVEITIYENPPDGNHRGEIRCWFPSDGGVVSSAVDGPLSGTGGGFWNAAGIAWGSEEVGIWLYDTSASYSTNDYKELSIAQNNDFMSRQGRSYFALFSVCDANTPIDSDMYSYSDHGMSWSRDITDNDFDSNGNLKPITIGRVFTRRLEWDGDTHGQTHPSVFIPNNTTVLEDMGPITSQQLGIDWNYYPWARKINGSWNSLNREYESVPVSANRNAYLRIRKNNAWDDVLNNLENPGIAESEVKSNGNWKQAVPYGTGA